MNKTRIKVEVRNGDISTALKIFKRRNIESGHIQELRDRKEYIKPSAIRRRQKLVAIYVQKKKILNENE